MTARRAGEDGKGVGWLLRSHKFCVEGQGCWQPEAQCLWPLTLLRNQPGINCQTPTELSPCMPGVGVPPGPSCCLCTNQ